MTYPILGFFDEHIIALRRQCCLYGSRPDGPNGHLTYYIHPDVVLSLADIDTLVGFIRPQPTNGANA